MLRVMPQNWEPSDWAEGLASRVAREIAKRRETRSAQWLSDRTRELGCRVSRSVITDLENGRRKYVAVHELIMLAEALSVAPLDLLYGNDNGAVVEFIPGDDVMKLVAIQRFSGISEGVLEDYEAAVTHLLSAAEAARSALSYAQEFIRRQRTDDGG